MAGTLFQAKIKVAESGDTPNVHVKVMQHLPHTGKGPEIQAFRAGQAEDAPLEFSENDIVFRTCMDMVEEPNAAADGNEEMKDESQPTATEAPQGQSISTMVNQ